LRVLVLDTSAFIMGFNPSGTRGSYTVEEVEKELLPGTTPYLRFQTSKEKEDLKIQDPSPQSRKTIEVASGETGDRDQLSLADKSIVALALDLKDSGEEPVIVSDDYAVQNLAEHLGLKYGALANFGIVHKFRWIMYCPACHRRYSGAGKKCPVCGTDLRRRVLSKTRVARE
jgi:endoribonuclease Nob1